MYDKIMHMYDKINGISALQDAELVIDLLPLAQLFFCRSDYLPRNLPLPVGGKKEIVHANWWEAGKSITS
jgi:hypothetical protein